MAWQVGLGKTDITTKTRGSVMLGYAYKNNVIEGVQSRLHARSVFLKAGDGTCFVYVNLEICFSTQALKNKVLSLIKADPALSFLDDKDVLLAAQHTHSGPSGHDHHPYYNVPTKGFVPEVLETLANGTYQSIKMAYENIRPGSLYFSKGEFELDKEVAFNRSLPAYISNPEVVNKNLTHAEATNRGVAQIELHQDGKIAGVINWFAAHSTSVSRDNTLMSSDNKGMASLAVEKHYREKEGREVVAIFAQTCPGDISPNYRKSTKNRREHTGKFDDFFENAKYHGGLQADKSLELISKAEKLELADTLNADLIYVDLGKVTVDDQFLPEDVKGQVKTTSPGCFGLAFAQGTTDGVGLGKVEYSVFTQVAKLAKTIESLKTSDKKNFERKYDAQANKDIFCETGNHKVMGLENLNFIPIPNFVDPMVATLKSMYRNGSLNHGPWVQEILPMHLVMIGGIALCSIPLEPTTISGLRLIKTVKDALGSKIQDVVVAGYSNTYAGYVVTPEEFSKKLYESGHTLFGRYTLPALQTIYHHFAKEMMKPREQRNLDYSVQPLAFNDEVLRKRTYVWPMEESRA